jgi:DNA-binding MarR family transcriptional regulator
MKTAIMSTYITLPTKGKDTFTGSLLHLLHKVTFLLERHLEKKLLIFSPLTFSQFIVLMGISAEQQTTVMTQSYLADTLHMTEATVSRHLKTLEKEGLILKERDESNKKVKLLLITNKGKQTLFRAENLVLQEVKSLFSCFNQTEKNTITHHCTTLLHNLLSKG